MDTASASGTLASPATVGLCDPVVFLRALSMGLKDLLDSGSGLRLLPFSDHAVTCRITSEGKAVFKHAVTLRIAGKRVVIHFRGPGAAGGSVQKLVLEHAVASGVASQRVVVSLESEVHASGTEVHAEVILVGGGKIVREAMSPLRSNKKLVLEHAVANGVANQGVVGSLEAE